MKKLVEYMNELGQSCHEDLAGWNLYSVPIYRFLKYRLVSYLSYTLNTHFNWYEKRLMLLNAHMEYAFWLSKGEHAVTDDDIPF